MRKFLKLSSLSVMASVMLCGSAFAQSTGGQTFGSESHEYASEAQAYQGQGEHKKAVKRLKKGLKVDGLSAYETSTMYQMMGNSYYAQKKYDDALEAFQNAINGGGLSQRDKRSLQVNIAQLNIAEKSYALGAQQLETYFREGGLQKPKLVKMVMQAHMRAENRAAAVPWAEAMLRQNLLQTKRDHDVAIYLFDSPEKRSSQMQVARQLLAKWPTDPEVREKIGRLNVKAKIDGVPEIALAGN